MNEHVNGTDLVLSLLDGKVKKYNTAHPKEKYRHGN